MHAGLQDGVVCAQELAKRIWAGKAIEGSQVSEYHRRIFGRTADIEGLFQIPTTDEVNCWYSASRPLVPELLQHAGG